VSKVSNSEQEFKAKQLNINIHLGKKVSNFFMANRNYFLHKEPLRSGLSTRLLIFLVVNFDFGTFHHPLHLWRGPGEVILKFFEGLSGC
jgi:hypothetical protein